MKNITIQQLTKKLDHSHNEIKVLEEQKDSLLKLFSMIKKKVDEGSVTIEPKESVKPLNTYLFLGCSNYERI